MTVRYDVRQNGANDWRITRSVGGAAAVDVPGVFCTTQARAQQIATLAEQDDDNAIDPLLMPGNHWHGWQNLRKLSLAELQDLLADIKTRRPRLAVRLGAYVAQQETGWLAQAVAAWLQA